MKDQILLGNNFEKIKLISDKSLDLILTDPYFETMSIGNSKATKQDKKSNFIDILPLLYDKLKNDRNLVFFCSLSWMLKNFNKIEDNNFTFQYEIIWNKNRGVSFLTAKKRPLQKHESIFVFSKGKHRYFSEQAKTYGHKPTKRGIYEVKKDYVNIKTNEHVNDGSRFMTTVLDYKVSSYNKQTKHPFEKPIDLCSHLISAYSKENDLILDPYSGSGNICVSAKLKNRHYIGIEIAEEYYIESIENLNNNSENLVDESKKNKSKINKFMD